MSTEYISLDNRAFEGVENSPNGEVSDQTRFHYHEANGAIWAEYSGGTIVRGTLLGTRQSPSQITFVYQHLNKSVQILTGEGVSTVEILGDGRLRLHEKWRWTSRDQSSGTSVVEEVAPHGDEGYQKRIQSYGAGEDSLEIQRNAPDILATLVGGIANDLLQRRPTPEKWSVSEIIAHLADDELVSACRYRQILERPGCNLGCFDQDLWASLGNYKSCSPTDSLTLFQLLRNGNLRVLRELTSEQWQRFGFHPERGRVTVRSLAQHMVGHDCNHILQICRILECAPPAPMLPHVDK